MISLICFDLELAFMLEVEISLAPFLYVEFAIGLLGFSQSFDTHAP